MREAVIVSTARTPIGKAYRRSFHDTSGRQPAAHAMTGSLGRAGADGQEPEDVVFGCAIQEGSTGIGPVHAVPRLLARHGLSV
ncbi:thiolase family protein [Streptomyces sp. NPDC004290]